MRGLHSPGSLPLGDTIQRTAAACRGEAALSFPQQIYPGQCYRM